MLNNLLTALTWGFCCGVVGVVYANVLAYEDFFNRWWKWGNRFEKTHPNLFKLFFVCSHCFAGQFAAWSFTIFMLIRWHRTPELFDRIEIIIYYPFQLFFAIPAAILTAKLLSFYFKKNDL